MKNEKEQPGQDVESSQKPDLKAIVEQLAESELEDVSGGGHSGPTFNVVAGCGC